MKKIVAGINSLKKYKLLQLFTVYLRYLIGAGFFAAAIAMGKLSDGVYVMGSNLKPIQELSPIQQFFRVMTDSGMYWKFIGWTQIIGASLLITQRYAKLGALIFFGLILNIFVITLAFEFAGTPLVTGLMLLATIYLLLWDIDSLQFIILKPDAKNLVHTPALPLHDHKYWSVLGALMILGMITVLLIIRDQILPVLAVVFIGFIGLIVFALRYKKYLFGKAQ